LRIRDYIFVLILAFYFSACKRDEALYPIENLNNNRIEVFGHGGMGNKYRFPINTFRSITEVLSLGVNGTEMDLQLTKDSVLVLLHNTKLEEVTRGEKGFVYDKKWEEIKGSKLKSFSAEKEQLIGLEELMDKLRASNISITNYIWTLDCKLYNGNSDRGVFLRQFANSILRTLDKYQLNEFVFVESTDSTLLRLLKSKRPLLKTFIYTGKFEESFAIAKKMGLYGITMNANLISTEQVRLAHQNNQRVTLWAVENKGDNMRAIGKSPDFIQTDNPRHLVKVFK
jgi:glycerophosphoryl diester phosphodiesterase